MAKDMKIPAAALDRLSYGRWWDFLDQPDTFQMPLAQVTAHADADGDTSATLVGLVPRAARLIGGALCVSVNSAGIDANNTSNLVISDGSSTVIAKESEDNLVADTPVTLDAPSITDLAANTILKLAITNGTNADLNSAVCQVTLTMADHNNFPAPGLKVIATNGGTCSISDGVKGICALSPGATDNDEIYIVAATETIKFASGKTFILDAELTWTEANTDDANVIFGCMNNVGANALIDDGGGPRATGDYVAMWKVDGGTVWRAGVQSNGTQKPTTDTDSEVTAGGSSYQRLRVKVVCETSTRAYAEFSVDGVNIATTHFDYASATEMQLVLGVKSGGANAETLNVDRLNYAVLR